MAKSILKDYLISIDKLKDAITVDSEELLRALDVPLLLSYNAEQKRVYLTEVLMDFWEAQNKKIDKAIELGEDKAKLLINATE